MLAFRSILLHFPMAISVTKSSTVAAEGFVGTGAGHGRAMLHPSKPQWASTLLRKRRPRSRARSWTLGRRMDVRDDILKSRSRARVADVMLSGERIRSKGMPSYGRDHGRGRKRWDPAEFCWYFGSTVLIFPNNPRLTVGFTDPIHSCRGCPHQRASRVYRR
jgi:hypothetical protein